MSDLQDQLKKTVKSLSNNAEFSKISGADNTIDKKEFEQLKLPPAIGKKLFEHLAGLDEEPGISEKDIRIAVKTLSLLDETPKKERTPKPSKTAPEVIEEMENESVLKKLGTKDTYIAKSGRAYQVVKGEVFYNSTPNAKNTWGCISNETAYYKTDNKFIKLYAVVGTDRICASEDLKFVLDSAHQLIKPKDGIYKLPEEQSYFTQEGDNLERCDASGTLRKEFIANLIKKLEAENFIVEHDTEREGDIRRGEIALKIVAPKHSDKIKLPGNADLRNGMIHLVDHAMSISIYEKTGLFKIDGPESGGSLSIGRNIDQAVDHAKSIRDEIIGRTESLNQTREQTNKKIVEDITTAISNNNSSSVKTIINSSSSLGSLARPAILELVDSRSDKLSLCGCLLALRLKDEEMISRVINQDRIFDALLELKTVDPSLDSKNLHRIFLEELKKAVDNNSSGARQFLMLGTNHSDYFVRDSLKPVKISKDLYVEGGEEVLANYRYSPKGQNVDLIDEANRLRGNYKEGTWQHKALARFSRARGDGFDFPERLRDRSSNQDWYEEIKKDSLREPQKNQKVAVLLICRTDFNGALYNIGERVGELKKQNYHVVYREIGSKEEFIATAKELSSKKKADLLLIGGHSYQDATYFGQYDWPGTESLKTRDKNELISAGVGGLLKENGRIVFAACSVGKGKAEAENMANMMREIFPQATKEGIWSMTEPGNIDSLRFNSQGVLEKVHFTVKEEETYRATLDDVSRYLNIA